MATVVESLASYATDERIITLIAKERGKCAAKCKKPARKLDDSGTLFGQVRAITPPHKEWIHPGRGKLPKKGEKGLAKWTSDKKRATARVLASIKSAKEKHSEAEWLQRMNLFIGDIQSTISGESPMEIETPKILHKFKKSVTKNGPFIYRPLCMYSDLKTKIILSLASGWLLSIGDKYFGRHMFFMRTASRQQDGQWKVPNFLDAIDKISDYRYKHSDENIFVGECDIQKFYDIFNHDNITKCFEELFDEIRMDSGAEDSTFDPFRRVLESYLGSYSFPTQVLVKNSDPDFWKSEKGMRRSKKCPEPECLFSWVDEEDFISSGCYTPEEFDKAKAEGKIGIPQGGALSGVIVNVVMHSIDKHILGRKDDNRLFLRYCDDIILMNTDKAGCMEDLLTYKDQLTLHRLLYHPFKEVSDLKRGRRNRGSFWEAKSKEPYLWGKGEGDASNWVAFLGYELHRRGDIRVRKDKTDQELRKIKRTYYSAIKSKSENRTEENFVKKFGEVADHLLDYEKITMSKFTLSQAKRLDKHLIWNAKKAAREIGLPSSVVEKVSTYSDIVRGNTGQKGEGTP